MPSCPDLISRSFRGTESTLRLAQGDSCHGEPVEPWIVRSSLAAFGGAEGDQGRTITTFRYLIAEVINYTAGMNIDRS